MESILFIGRNPKQKYSGGRYHAMIMAIALAKNFKVTYLTNNIPKFIDDFKLYDEFNNINFDLSLFSIKCNYNNFDYIVFSPDMNPFSGIYQKAICILKNSNAKLILISFDTPNFYNLGSIKKFSFFWSGWKLISSYSSLILSSTKISNKFAINFFDAKHKSKCKYLYPAINERIANKFKHVRSKSILVVTRSGPHSDHKGSNEINRFFNKNFENYTFNIIGLNNINKAQEYKSLANKFNITLNFHFGISDYEKYKLISSSECLIFPSRFEGYGYPPIEAGYFGIPSILNSLDIFKEIHENYPLYLNEISLDDYHIFIEKHNSSKYKELIRNKINFDNYQFNLRKFLGDINKKENAKVNLLQYWMNYFFFIVLTRIYKFLIRLKLKP